MRFDAEARQEYFGHLLVLSGASLRPTSITGLTRLVAICLAASLSLPSLAGPSEDANAAYVSGDFATALRLWRDLAEQGDAPAQTHLGVMYRDGRGVPRDGRQAVEWFRRAADLGDAVGQTNLGIMYQSGRGVDRDDQQAVEWFRRAAEQGNALGEANLGFMYQSGRGVDRDDQRAVEWFRKAAEQGNALGEANLGFMFQSGRGVDRDDRRAVEWLRKAAEQGNALGEANLGFMFQSGRGVDRDEKQAVEWFRKAAEQGNALGEVNLGATYARGGGGLQQDDRQAVEWFRKAAGQDSAFGQISLGNMYRLGRGGLPQDDKQAVDWFRKAAEQGLADAQYDLGFMYQHGRGGLAEDTKEAMEWYHKAADQGNAQALASLNASQKSAQVLPGLSRTVAELVKANEKAPSSEIALDPNRVALAREVIDIAGAPQAQTDQAAEINEGLANLKFPPSMSPRFIEAMRVTLIASFKRDRLLASWERRLAEKVDAGTLQAGLLWDRSELGHRMHLLEVASAAPEQRAAMMQFARAFVSKGGRSDDARGRACAQADTLADKTESIVPLLEAMTAGVMIGSAQKAPTMDMEAIRRAVVAARPLLHEAARQSVLGQCLYVYRELSDAEVDQWLEFLRSDSGGRYARGLNDSRRDSLLDATEVFTRTLVEVAGQLKGQGDS